MRKGIIVFFTVLIIIFYVLCSTKRHWFTSKIPFKLFSACGKWKRKVTLINQWQTPLDKDIAKENLAVIHDIFSRNGLFFWLSEGTALGYFRDNDIIEWDDDVDVGIFHKDKSVFVNIIIPQMIRKGFTIVQGFNNFYSFERKGVDVDIDITGNGVMSIALMDDGDKIMPHLKDFNTCNIYGREFHLPKIDYMICLYGNDWYIPKKGMAGKPFSWRAIREVVSGN